MYKINNVEVSAEEIRKIVMDKKRKGKIILQKLYSKKT